MALTKKHYKEIAQIINDEFGPHYKMHPDLVQVKAHLCSKLADYFEADNPNFNRERFMDACYND